MKRCILIFAVILTIYVSSYVLLSENYSKNKEIDGCGIDRCKYIDFPENKIFLLFSPLIIIDRFTTRTEVYIKD